MDTKSALLDEMALHKADILAILNLPVLEDRFQTFAGRIIATKNMVDKTRKRLPMLKLCHTYRDTINELVEWLTESISAYQKPLVIDSRENLSREIEAHGLIKVAVQKTCKVVEETVANAKTLEAEGRLSETDIKGTQLKLYDFRFLAYTMGSSYG